MSSTVVVVLTLVTYQCGLLAIGWWVRSRARTTEGFFLGGRQLGPWVAALSYAAGSSSAWSILGVSGIAFSQGLSSFWLVPGTITGHIVVWFWVAPRLQKQSHEHRYITLTDLLVKGLSTRTARLVYRLSAVAILFSFTFYVAAQFQGAANTFTAVFDFSFVTALLLGVAVVIVYTLWGGFWAVSITDALQAVLMLIAAILLPTMAVIDIGGWSALYSMYGQPGDYWSWSGGDTGWFAAGFVLGMLSIGFGPLGQPHLLNRIMAMGSAKDIRLARGIALLWFVVVLGGMFILGVCARVVLGEAGEDAEHVFFVMADRLLPAVFTGVLIASVLSAIMSTADSQLLVAGSAIHHDLAQDDLAQGRAAQTSAGQSARLAVVGVAIAATALALFLPDSIFSRVLFAWNALGAAFGPLVIVRLSRWQLADWSVPTALCLGFGLTVVLYSLPNGPGDIWERLVPFLVGFVTLLVGSDGMLGRSTRNK